jgi:hypothetical protein
MLTSSSGSAFATSLGPQPVLPDCGVPAAPPRWGALIAGGAALFLYASTMAPGVGWYDSAELTAAAATWGIPHAPGYPLYTLLTWLACQGPFDPATVTNGFSVLSAAFSVALCWTLIRNLGGGTAGAYFGAALLATSAWLWNNATVAEVYAPGLCVVLGVFLLLFRARARREVLPVLLAGGLAGLGLGLHYGVATCGLGFGLLVLLHLPPEPLIGPGQAHAARKLPDASLRFGLRMAGGAALWASAGAAVNYALLTFRAARDPAVNALSIVPPGDPVLWLALGGSYRAWWGKESSLGLLSKGAILGTELALQLQVGLLLALLGLAVLLRGTGTLLGRSAELGSSGRVVGGSLCLALCGNIGFFLRYDVHDLENFFLPTLALLCVAAGVGLGALQGLVRARWSHIPRLPDLAWLLLFLPFLQLGAWEQFDRSEDHSPENYLEALDAHLPHNSILIRTTLPREWHYDTVFTAWYQQALGKRSDVRVLTRPVPSPQIRKAASNEIRLHAQLGRAVFVLHPDSAEVLGFKYHREGPAFRLVMPAGLPVPQHP